MQLDTFIPNTEVVLNEAFLFPSLAKENTAFLHYRPQLIWVLTSCFFLHLPEALSFPHF